MPFDIDGRSIQHVRLPSHSQGYCSTHERPGISGPVLKSLPRPPSFAGLPSTSGPPPRASQPRSLIPGSRPFYKGLLKGRLLGLLQTSFRLSGRSAYTDEKVLLLTKMDLTEFRS